MFLDLLDVSILLLIVLCISTSFVLYRTRNSPTAGYILRNQVTHARLLPKESKHAFTYPTACLLVSLNALETHALDLGFLGCVFKYGGLFGRLLGLRSKPYLFENNETLDIRGKLDRALQDRGFNIALDATWMMTMPSFLGYEGINPLTVYFCYVQGKLEVTVLEIHNTFGEGHIHILQTGILEDETSSPGFDHQWTFHRQFHVSPFNDRSGFYRVSIKEPSHPPDFSITNTIPPPPLPAVRVHLHAIDPLSSFPAPGPLKLTALLLPVSALPLTTAHVLRTLIQAPLVLMLAFPRILYQAWFLHYRRGLPVHLRPEPHPVTQNGIHADGEIKGGGVKWLPESPLEAFARRRVEDFLRSRVFDLAGTENNIQITLIAGDPSMPRQTFGIHGGFDGDRTMFETLTITFLSARFFTVLFLAPSAAHALLLGCDTEGVFRVPMDQRELFLRVFSSGHEESDGSGTKSSAQHIRTWRVPSALKSPQYTTTKSMARYAIPVSHPLDSPGGGGTVVTTKTIGALLMLLSLERIEQWVFDAIGAKVYEGGEAWFSWERATTTALAKKDSAVDSEKVGTKSENLLV